MEALRFVATPVDHQVVITIPPGFSGGELEIIVLPKECSTSSFSARRRSPPRQLAGSVKILGDIMAPVVAEEDWDALR